MAGAVSSLTYRSAFTAIADWERVKLGGEPQRVTKLFLAEHEFSRTISPESGRLSKLTTLTIMSNGLTGAIPSTLGDLSDLQFL